MKNRIFTSLMVAGMLAGAGFLTSCEDDETFADPILSLSETAVTAAPGEDVTITINGTVDAELESIVITKLWDGAPQNVETLTAIPTSYTYTVTDEDADHILSINFLVTDVKGKTASVDLVITVELTARQLLLKYNWRLSEEIRQKTNEDDINDAYNDDVYRFNADGTYEKSHGAKKDDFGDLVTNYCFYVLDDNTMRLQMSRSENFFGSDAIDVLDITIIDDSKLYADVTYTGLDVFNTGSEEVPYEAEEDYEKRFVAVAKTSSFDPYDAGADDDNGPGECREVEFDN